MGGDGGIHPMAPSTARNVLFPACLRPAVAERAGIASFRAEASTENAGAVWRLPGVREEDVLGTALGNETKMT